MIFPLLSPAAMQSLLEESAIDQTVLACRIAVPICLSVRASQNESESDAETTINFRLRDKTIEAVDPPPRTDHLLSKEPEDESKRLILLYEAARSWRPSADQASGDDTL